MSEIIGRIQVLWDGLAPRERVLVGAAGAAAAFALLVLGVILPIRGAVESAKQGAQDAEQQLVQMQRMKREWDDLHTRLASVEGRIQSGGEGQNLLTLLESLAARAGVKPTSMEKRQSGESARYEETKVEVSLKNVTLQQAVSYLASIETAAQPLSVKSLRIKRRSSGGAAAGAAGAGADLIDVTFSVSGFKPISA
ncbi:MAG: type II secretion system protein GspM [Myxococcota bacterium]